MVRRGTTLVVDGSLLFVVVAGDEEREEKGLNNLWNGENRQVSQVAAPSFRGSWAVSAARAALGGSPRR